MTDEVQKNPLDTIQEQWSKDAKLDAANPGKDILQISVLHAKYMKHLTKHSLMVKNAESKLKTLWQFKSDYYNGYLNTPEELAKHKLPPFKIKLLKTEVRERVEAEPDIQELLLKKYMHEKIVDLCTSIIKQLEQRSYSLSSYIEWLKFSAGDR